MSWVFALALGLAGLMISIPGLALLALTLAAGKRPPAAVTAGDGPVNPRVALLVPAHNESRNVLPTIACLLPQLGPGDRLLVVADNCSDDTAEVARQAGATVVERHDPTLRGKGYALAFGVDHLRADPPDVVMVVDADCVVTPNAVNVLARRCVASGNPVQMLNLMHAPVGAGVRLRILEFAMVMKNLVRPLGAWRLGGACHLMGTGMALPWGLMSTARLATGHIAEDMKLGVELALAGHPAGFCLDAEVSSLFPDDSQVARTQKSRWEHGHLATLQEELPRMLRTAVGSGRGALWVMALDLLIPPMALYVMVLFGSWVAMLLLAVFWAPAGLAASLLGLAALATMIAVCLGWSRYARHLLSARELFTTPLYALWKIPVYIAFALRRRSGWVRTKRGSE